MMTQNTPLFQTLTHEPTDPATCLEKECDGLSYAMDEGKIGEIVAKVQRLIVRYYQDVQNEAMQSFNLARFVAIVGFGVLILTLLYKLVIDLLFRTFAVGPSMSGAALSVSEVGLASGFIIEFIASIIFVLYARVAKQFSAFHICLERTHRYLLAYKIAEQMKENKDKTFQDLVCIMAKAPMITRADIDSITSDGSVAKSGQRRPMPTEVTMPT
jgi:hypothetical protein